jgi:hypothetical protein
VCGESGGEKVKRQMRVRGAFVQIRQGKWTRQGEEWGEGDGGRTRKDGAERADLDRTVGGGQSTGSRRCWRRSIDQYKSVVLKEFEQT